MYSNETIQSFYARCAGRTHHLELAMPSSVLTTEEAHEAVLRGQIICRRGDLYFVEHFYSYDDEGYPVAEELFLCWLGEPEEVPEAPEWAQVIPDMAQAMSLEAFLEGHSGIDRLVCRLLQEEDEVLARWGDLYLVQGGRRLWVWSGDSVPFSDLESGWTYFGKTEWERLIEGQGGRAAYLPPETSLPCEKMVTDVTVPHRDLGLFALGGLLFVKVTAFWRGSGEVEWVDADHSNRELDPKYEFSF